MQPRITGDERLSSVKTVPTKPHHRVGYRVRVLLKRFKKRFIEEYTNAHQ